MKQDFNYHTHTSRCGHAADASDEQYVQAAIEAGFKILGFSDHRPYRHYSKRTDRMDWFQLEDYIASLKHLREKYRDQIDIKIGFETEYFPQLQPEIDLLLARGDVDYLILGQHYWDYELAEDFCRGGSEENLREYARLLEEGMETGRFLYLAHPDYFLSGQKELSEAGREVAHRLGRKAAETGTPVEINLNQMRPQRGRRNYPDGSWFPYPNRPFWEILSQYPIKCLYGFDAHYPGLLKDTFYMEEAEKELSGLNLTMIREPLI
ncbi:MAG: histidinol-phosphatase [Erysipelotrichaceae bacterium]|nr:histidinol-phosphatase [Erysipelotrichaceae bacterium]